MTASPTKLALLKKAENDLLDHAILYATGDIADTKARMRHLALADEYARARWATATGGGGRRDAKPTTSTMRLPIGRSKGQSIGDAKTPDLRWVLGVVEESINDIAKERFRAENVKLRDAILAELEFRGES